MIDGMPILWLAKMLRIGGCERITGVDLSQALIEKAAEKNLSLAVIGGAQNVLDLAARNIREQHPQVDLFFTASPTNSQLMNSTYVAEISKLLAERDKKIVLLCLGSPKQERLYVDLIENSNQKGVFLCIGAAVDFIARVKTRAPKVIQILGFEWLFRFLQEPRRLFRRYFLVNSRILPYLFAALIFWIRRRPDSKHQ
jgi:N-acetylglucosaminyldiphosphoundecaprenol N-acetyl-beta-D-mannosaminyltransferase